MSYNQVNASQNSPSIKPEEKTKPDEKDEKSVSALGTDKKDQKTVKK